jgi:hypothetical protein
LQVKEGVKKDKPYPDLCGGALHEILAKRKALDE